MVKHTHKEVGIITYGEDEKEQNKVEQKKGTRLHKGKICLQKKVHKG